MDPGVRGLVPGGSTGELTALSQDKPKTVFGQAVKSAAGRVRVVAGVGAFSQNDTGVDLVKHTASLKVAAPMIVPPFYDPVNYEELDIPAASGLTLSPAQAASLKSSGIKYLEDTSGNGPALLTDLLFDYADDVTTFNGLDSLTFYGVAAGAKGSV